MFESIKNKKVLVTGATSGIGLEIAKLFAAHGASVGIHYRNNDLTAKLLLNEIQDLGVQAELFKGDLLDRSVRDGLVSSFIEKFGCIDILVNNAGACFDYQHFSTLKEDSWDKTFALNTKAPFCLSRDAFKFMKNHDGGVIINITTVAVKYVGASSLHYTASKAALDTLTRGFAREGAKDHIRVNSIRCGVIETAMHSKIPGYDPENFKKRVDMIPIGHIGNPIDIARMALFLASESGEFITGECFSVAGGD